MKMWKFFYSFFLIFFICLNVFSDEVDTLMICGTNEEDIVDPGILLETT